MLTSHELRQKYLEFFKSKGHTIIPSASLIPENDPTTLFTSSGMQPLIPYLLGEKHPLGTRLVNSQKSFRSQDIEDVGDNRHTTFFEMLGNWSLGDPPSPDGFGRAGYFKAEQIPWIFEFITKELGLDPNRLYFTCFIGNEALGIPKDTEAAELWKELLEKDGVDADAHIFYYDEKKNWWSRSGVPGKMPVGEPGGPDTEMFWDFGEKLGLHETSQYKDQPCHVNCDCGRFLEIGNSVFMEYRKTHSTHSTNAQGGESNRTTSSGQASFEKLKQRNVDFGGGLERMKVAMDDNPDIFTIDLFAKMRTELEKISGKRYGDNMEMNGDKVAFRVILDHIRAATFLIGDGAVPSNKDQGYFTRRLIRRAIRYADKLGITEKFCAKAASAVVEEYQEAYPKLLEKKETIAAEMEREEERFRGALKKGLKELQHIIAEKKTITGKDAFDLYQNFGFPKELTLEVVKQMSGSITDEEQFFQEFKKHQDLSRAGSEKKFHGGLADHSEMSIKYHTATHLLHAALQKVLGKHAEQRGSNITPERLRFDFVHHTKMTPEEIKKTEDLVNAAILRNYPVSYQLLSVADAKAKGAIGLFEEKYGEQVKVYTVGDPEGVADADPKGATFSREFCGGPHVEHTGVIGKFKIVKEEAVSAGIRRIKAIVE